jgi:hypothetical protein
MNRHRGIASQLLIRGQCGVLALWKSGRKRMHDYAISTTCTQTMRLASWREWRSLELADRSRLFGDASDAGVHVRSTTSLSSHISRGFLEKTRKRALDRRIMTKRWRPLGFFPVRDWQ